MMSIEVTCSTCGEEFDSRRERCPACPNETALVVLIVRYENEGGGWTAAETYPAPLREARRTMLELRGLGYYVDFRRAKRSERRTRCPGCNGDCGAACERRG